MIIIVVVVLSVIITFSHYSHIPISTLKRIYVVCRFPNFTLQYSYLTTIIPSYFRGISLVLNTENLSESNENKTTDPISDTQLQRGSQPNPSQQASSAAGHEEDKSLLQSENNKNIAIQKVAPNEEYPYTLSSSLGLNDRDAARVLCLKMTTAMRESESPHPLSSLNDIKCPLFVGNDSPCLDN